MKEVLSITKERVSGLISFPRGTDTDKRDYGDLLIFAGKEGMAGAAIMTAMAALRSGTGLVKVVTPENNYPSLQQALPEAICVPEEDLSAHIKHCTAIVIGPGMGADERTEGVIRTVFEELKAFGREVPVLIDADGLNAIAGNEDLKKFVAGRTGAEGKAESNACDGEGTGHISLVITPHKREAGRLLGRGPIEKEDRIEACVELSELLGCTTLLKGDGTLISTYGSGTVWKNTTGNPGMATAGSGDVLSGIIGGFLAQGLATEEAAIAGAYIHGLAGDMVAESIGERSLIASDILVTLPAAFKRL